MICNLGEAVFCLLGYVIDVRSRAVSTTELDMNSMMRVFKGIKLQTTPPKIRKSRTQF